ncbi:hypothetical protein BDY24DRAFT_387558 [Mrakia frigida]|uniref:uncharacterized protein n=1 Tax=Mrakia frigida TaxID=29902 RepID=UPI003FCBF212
MSSPSPQREVDELVFDVFLLLPPTPTPSLLQSLGRIDHFSHLRHPPIYSSSSPKRMASLRLLARASSSRASSLLPSSSRSIPTLRSNSTIIPPPPPPASTAATEPSSSSSSSSVPSLASTSTPSLESTGLVVTRTGKSYPALPPRLKELAPRAPDSPIPMSDEERLAQDKVEKVLISDEQLIWIVGISMFAGAGWWAMRVKDKKRTQGALINEMRTRRLYDSGTLDDDE